MTSPGNDQGAPKGGAERTNEQAGTDNKSNQQGTGPQGGHEQQGPYGPGGYPFPPWWAMNPGMAGPYGMYGGMPGGPQGAAHHHHPHRPWEPHQQNCPPSWPWGWMSWFMPWLGPWWSWVSSWFVWPGTSWMMPPFSFSPFGPPPWYPGAPVPEQTMRFAETRASFYRHLFEAQADIYRQAANASYVPGYMPGYMPGYVPPPPIERVDIAQLKKALEGLPEPQAALVIHAVQMLQAWDSMRPQQRAGSDW